MKPRIGSIGQIVVAAMAVLVLMAAPNTAHAIQYSLGNFLVLVDDQLVLKGAADVNCCHGTPAGVRSDLGSRNSIVLGGTLSTDVPVGAPALKDVAVIAPSVTLNNFAHVSMVIYDLTTGTYVVSGSGIVQPSAGNLFSDLGNNPLNNTGSKTLPAFPSFPTITVGAADVVVPQSGSVTISPGNYRDLLIGAFGTINFSQPGIYQFRRIITATASTYELVMQADGVQINVKEFVHLSEFGDVNPTGKSGLTIYVEGFDGTYAGANKNKNGVTRPAGTFPAAFEFGGDASFEACFVFVKNGTANLRGHSLFATQWFGNSLQEISNLGITMESPGEICFTLTSQCP